MKRSLTTSLALAAVLVTGSVRAAETLPDGAVDFGRLSPAGDGKFLEVSIKSNLINMVAKLAESHEPEAAKILRGLKAVRVNVIGLNDENRADIKERIAAVRSQLDRGDWERIVTARQEGQDIGVFIKLRGEEAVEGLVVTVINQDREAVLVNVVGDIRPSQIAQVGERLNIEPLKDLGRTINGEQ